MRLLELLKGIDILECGINLDINIKNIFSDSRKATKNGIFVAIKGERRDGNQFISDVIKEGDNVIITDDYNSYIKHMENGILVKDARLALSFLWNNYYNTPTSNMKIIAITGTNGKTSCAHYIYSILKRANKKRGMISTIQCLIDEDTFETFGGSEVLDLNSAMTTPDPEILYSIFNEMRNRNVEYVVMEASSHALKQSKLAPIKIDCAVFTNLSAEHLDFHKNMDDYFQSKKKLFDNNILGIANIDDEFGKSLFEEKENVYSCSKKTQADFFATDVKLTPKGYTYNVNYKEKKYLISGKIGGEFSVYNSLLSVACGILMGINIEDIILGISDVKQIKGRLEKIENNDIFIDYAHTPVAMKNILQTLREIYSDRPIIVLFGCGGDRDKSKRSVMGQIASETADLCIITSDNSRNENSVEIIRDILLGIKENSNYIVIPNREMAISYAVSQMKQDSVLILLGKGHEMYEINRNGKHYFNEREIVVRALKNDKD